MSALHYHFERLKKISYTHVVKGQANTITPLITPYAEVPHAPLRFLSLQTTWNGSEYGRAVRTIITLSVI